MSSHNPQLAARAPTAPTPFATIPTTVFAREFEGELVLLDVKNGEYFGLAGVGRELWDGLASGECLDTMSRRLADRYDCPPATLAADLAALTEELHKRGLIVLAVEPKGMR
jgi:Coenzyme PQQ synthesis protein D (PqqD)